MVINPAGRLGIGTTSPSSQLHLKTQNSTSADNSGAGFYVLDHATDSFRYAQVWLNADGGEYGYTSDGNFAYLEKRSSATDGGSLRLHNGDSGPIEFWTRNTGGSGLSKKMELDSDGNLKIISGMGVLRTVYGVRAWVNFNGTGTVAIRDSGNVSSITDDGTVNYSVNFTTAMPDANYAVLGTAGHTSASNLIALTVNRVSGSLPATGSVHVYTSYANTYAFDSINTSVAIVR